MEHYQQTSQQTIESFKSSLDKGLDLADAEKRLEQYGQNELVERGKKSPWMIFLDQFKEVMVIVLIIAALVSAFLGEYTEVVVIMAIVVLNSILWINQK